MRRQYPYLYEIQKMNHHGHGSCFICREGKSDRLAVIQTSWFRGDDVYITFHDKCLPNDENRKPAIMKRAIEKIRAKDAREAKS